MALRKNPMAPPPPHGSRPPLSPYQNSAVPKPPAGSPVVAKPTSKPFWLGLGTSIAWVVGVMGVVAKTGPAHTFGGVAMADWALGISAAVSPVAMVWMITAYLQRASDIQSIAEPLRRQLTLITGESGAADARIRRFNQAIREQIELLRSAQTISQGDLEAFMTQVREHRGELERLENASTHQIKDIQDVVRRSMLQVEQMMDDKFTMLKVLDGKLQQNSDGVARQVESVRDQVARMLEDVEGGSIHIAEALDRAQRDGKKLSDIARLQESSLTGAAAAAADTLGGLTTKIDFSVAKFLERASSAREEAERLAHALDAQTRALDDFSGTLPARVSEAESVLRGVADRLYASEQMAREQALHLSDKLSQQVDGLQSFMDRFTARLHDIDHGLDRRHSDLHGLAERIGTTTTGFVASWEQSLNDLHDRTSVSLGRFSSINEDTRRNSNDMAAQLADTTGKYEDAVARMRSISTDGNVQLKGMTEQIASYLAQFETLSKASAKAGGDVQERAGLALQNLQHVLERVLAARDATQGVGETLVKDIYSAVDHNEKMIARLSETAQAGARALGLAAEAIGRQQSDLAGKTRAGETVLVDSLKKLQQQAEIAGKGLREQTNSLMGILSETQSQLAVTDQKLQGFAANAVTPVQKAVQQIDASAEQGLRSLTHYGDGLGQQVAKLQDFHARVGSMGEAMSRTTSESAVAFENLATRFAQTRAQQEEAAKLTLAQFADLTDRLQRETGSLDGQAAAAVDILQQSARQVGEQSYQMLQNAQNAGAQIKDVAASLKGEAAAIEVALRGQSDSVATELARAEQKFTALGETISARAQSAHELIDRVHAHYQSVSQTTASELEDRARLLEHTVGQAQTKVDVLHNALTRQSESIEAGAVRLENQAGQIAATSSRAAQNLGDLSDKMVATHEVAISRAQDTLVKLDDSAENFERRSRSLSETADTAALAVTAAGDAFNAQAARLGDSGHQIDATLRQLTGATSALAEQASQIRAHMEQQNGRLLSQLGESIAQMDTAGGKMQQLAQTATQTADQTASRFNEMADTANRRIDISTQELHVTAARTEQTLSALGANVTQQAASLSIVGEHIAQHQKILADAGETQRRQMEALFEQLGAAHRQASDVAERTMNYLNGSLHEIYRQIGTLTDRSQDAVSQVRYASGNFADQTAILIQNAQTAEQQARSILSVTSALQEQARYLGQSLQDESARAEQHLGGLLTRLSSGHADLRDWGASAEGLFAHLQKTLGNQNGELSQSMQQISDRQRSLTTALDQQRETIHTLLNRMILAQDETALVAERTVQRLGVGAQQLLGHVDAIDQRAQNAMISVHAAASGFAQEAELIETHGRQAEQQTQVLLSSAGQIGEQIAELHRTMENDGEKAARVIEILLEKATISSGEMRDIGEATRMSLTTLGHDVGRQTEGLTGSMQQISDKQRALTLSLDAQRDVVNGLLNRLTLAQDETAAVAERTAARIEDSALLIGRQTERMGAQAAAVGEQSGQAEQQMRQVLTTTTAMQEQARQLRAAMQDETGRMVDQLSGIIVNLDAANTRLRDESSAVVHTLDQTAQQFAAATRSGAEMIRAQADLLGQTAEQSEARMSNAGEKMRGHLRIVGEVGDQAENKARQLADTAEFATTRLVSLRDTLSAADGQSREMIKGALERIEASQNGFKKQIDDLLQAAQTTAGLVKDAGGSLSAQSEALRANLAASESALVAASGLLREEAAHLPALLGRNTAELDSVLRALKNYAGEADQALIGTADRFISVTTTARGTLIDEMQRIGAVANDADKVLRHFNRLLLDQVGSMQTSAAQLSSEQKQLVDQAASNVQALTSASDRLSILRGEAAQTAERLTADIDRLDARVASASDQIRQSGGGMAQQIGDLSRELAHVTTQLESTGAHLRSTTAGSVADVERIAQRFEQTGGQAAGQVEARSRQLIEATDQAEKILASFGQHFDAMLARMTKAGDTIRAQEGDTVGQLTRMLGHLSAVAEKLEAGRSLSGTVSQQAIERLDEVVNAVQTHMNNLTNGVQTAAGVMRGIGQIYSDQTDTLTRGVGEAHQQVIGMNKSVGDMQERTDRMRLSLQLQGEELMQSLRQILVQLEMTGDGLSEAVDRTLQQQATAGLDKMAN